MAQGLVAGHVGFVVHTVALGQGLFFSKYFCFSCHLSFHQCSIFIYQPSVGQRAL